MGDGEAARNAVEKLNNYVLHGKPLRVDYANRVNGYAQGRGRGFIYLFFFFEK
jgi:RNA recognition motif-containing protein